MQNLEDKKLCNTVNDEYQKRRRERSQFELQWQMNMNFLMGNQYCDIVPSAGEVADIEKQYFWQEREVFNHIAPIVETRLSKLSKLRPSIVVRPATGDESDAEAAKVCTSVVNACYRRQDISAKIAEAISWSEICGTVFYKVIWNNSVGKLLARTESSEIYDGDVEVSVCPAYEIFPDNNYAADIKDCRSIIHARVYSCDEVELLYGAKVEPSENDVIKFGGNISTNGGLGYNAFIPKVERSKEAASAVVLEYYEKPSKEHINGRLLIVSGENLLYKGDLPYVNGDNGTREFPFIRQVSLVNPGCIWGTSIIERCIPLQRAYNAVRNRKHEFLNRAAIGIMAVEEGAVDTESLEEDGLSPGKILVYRQGCNPPTFIYPGSLPSEFLQEEERLQEEFRMISGVSDLMRQSAAGSITSGVALSILNEQDDTRLALTAERIRECMLHMAKHSLRLYKQYAKGTRMNRIVGENGSIKLLYWKSNMLTSDDVVHETENELAQSVAQRRQMVFELFSRGMFADENGVMSDYSKAKVLRTLGMGDWENAQDLNELQSARAQRENIMLADGIAVAVSEIDDAKTHIYEHMKYMLSEQYEMLISKNMQIEQIFLAHIRLHKQDNIKENIKNE